MDALRFKTYYICNGKGECHDSEICGHDCHLTANNYQAKNDDASAAIFRFNYEFEKVRELFNIQLEPATHTIIFTEKERKNG